MVATTVTPWSSSSVVAAANGSTNNDADISAVRMRNARRVSVGERTSGSTIGTAAAAADGGGAAIGGGVGWDCLCSSYWMMNCN